MSHDHAQRCACSADHRPAPLELHAHHIHPLYLGGPDVPDNKVWLCPTAHTNVHELLRLMMRAGRLTWGEVTTTSEQPVSRYAFRLAHQALDRAGIGQL